MPALLLNPYVLLGLLAALAGSHWYAYHTGAKHERNEVIADEQRLRATEDAAQRGAAEAIAKLEIKQVTIRQMLEKEIHEKPVYGDCRHSPDGLRAVNAALVGADPAGDR